MKDTIEMIIRWVWPMVGIVLIVLVATRRGMRGKSWLIAQLVISLAVTLMWRLPELLSKLDMMGESGRSQFYIHFSLPLNILGLLGTCLLIPYVLEASSGEPTASSGSLSCNARTSPMTVGEALFSFQGRMSRRDYWLKGLLILLPIGIFNNILAYGVNTDGARLLSILIALASLWPGLALIVKRLHDRDRTGWLAATLLIPFINIIFAVWILIEVWFLRGTVGANRFGNDPLGLEAAQAVSEVGEVPPTVS